jgi:hypothetical protein
MQEKSPEFDHNDFEPILEWADAKIVVSRPEDVLGVVYSDPGSYSLVWEHGVIGFDFTEDIANMEQARRAAALFIYLWTRGVEAAIAEHCAAAYIITWRVTKI